MTAPCRLRHVIPTVGSSAPARLHDAQGITLRSIERALDFSRGRVDVDVVAARFPDEEPPARPWLRDAPVLESSAIDLVPGAGGRRLPLLREVLAAFGDASDHDAVVLTNIDIGVQPLFYEAIAEALASGLDAFTINRRDVSPTFRGDLGALGQSSTGRRHPGTDCFVMVPSVLAQVDVGEVLLGVRWVGATLRLAMELSTDRFRRFTDLNLTFHLGNDRIWKDDDFEDLTSFNRAEHVAAGGRQIRAASERDGLPAADSAPLRPKWEKEPMLIVAAATARSGTQYLARLLGSIPGVDAAHERQPTLAGAWLRDIETRGWTETYGSRSIKADALQTLLELRRDRIAVADINHLFVTAQYDVVLDAFDHSRLAIVDLRRDPVDIARSIYLMGWFAPGDDDEGAPWREWFLDPVPSSAGSGELDSDRQVQDRLERIFLHLADVMERRERLRLMTPTVKWVDADLLDIAGRAGARQLARDLGLAVPGRMWPPRSILRRIGVRSARKAAVGRRISRQTVELALERFLRRPDAADSVRALAEESRRWRRA